MSACVTCTKGKSDKAVKKQQGQGAYRKFPCKCGGCGGQGGASTRLCLYYHLSACEVSQGMLSIYITTGIPHNEIHGTALIINPPKSVRLQLYNTVILYYCPHCLV